MKVECYMCIHQNAKRMQGETNRLIHLSAGRFGLSFLCESYEAESSGATSLSIHDNIRITHVSERSKSLTHHKRQRSGQSNFLCHENCFAVHVNARLGRCNLAEALAVHCPRKASNKEFHIINRLH
jgi:hypothetical protein